MLGVEEEFYELDMKSLHRPSLISIALIKDWKDQQGLCDRNILRLLGTTSNLNIGICFMFSPSIVLHFLCNLHATDQCFYHWPPLQSNCIG